MTYSDSYPQSGNAYTANVRANFSAIKNVLSQEALNNGFIRAQVVSSDPSAGNKGRLIFNETEEVLKVDDGFNLITILPKVRVKTGSYVGNGNDDRSITIESGFNPDFVLLYVDDTTESFVRFVMKINNKTADQAYLDGTDAIPSKVKDDHIQALETDGFQVGSASPANKNGKTIRYIAIKEG